MCLLKRRFIIFCYFVQKARGCDTGCKDSGNLTVSDGIILIMLPL